VDEEDLHLIYVFANHMMLNINVLGSSSSDWIECEVNGTFVVTVDWDRVIYRVA